MFSKFDKGIMWVYNSRQKVPYICKIYKGFSIWEIRDQWHVIHNRSGLSVSAFHNRKHQELLAIFLADNYVEDWDGKFNSWLDISEGFQMRTCDLILQFNRRNPL